MERVIAIDTVEMLNTISQSLVCIEYRLQLLTEEGDVIHRQFQYSYPGMDEGTLLKMSMLPDYELPTYDESYLIYDLYNVISTNSVTKVISWRNHSNIINKMRQWFPELQYEFKKQRTGRRLYELAQEFGVEKAHASNTLTDYKFLLSL